MWLKYSAAPILNGEQWDRDQPERLSKHGKPSGLWITDDSEKCWRSWCVRWGFNLESLTHKHAVTLDESKILFLRSAIELDLFTREFSTWWGPDGEPCKYRDLCIDWREVAKRYTGIIITPYQWSHRLGYSWYYGWCCASGCVWKADAIRAIHLIEIDCAVAKKRDAKRRAHRVRSLSAAAVVATPNTLGRLT
jgi:hypothetical protein